MSIKQSCYFLSKFVKNPTQVAAVWPSSKQLMRQMLVGQELEAGDLIAEYGPGTGSFTAGIREAMQRDPSLRYVGLERDAGFVRVLQQRWPELRVELGYVQDLRHLVEELGPAKLIVSGLPLIAFPEDVQRKILEMTRDWLAPGGSFRTFSYWHSKPTAGTKRLLGLMDEIFGDVRRSRVVVRNVPPAYVIEAHPKLALEASSTPVSTAGSLETHETLEQELSR
jgi:phosphatidylethanolamine/phosphatidyl-N-methylethanolamine N-methyltransferase